MTLLKERISLSQLFVILILFEVGSAIIVGLGNEAKQDTWIAIPIATGIGIGLVWMYHTLAKQTPDKHWFEIMETLFNRPIAVVLSCIYISYFLYIAARVVRDFSELLATAIMPNTPIEVMAILLMLVIAYIVFMGLEVLSRVGETFLPYVLLFLLFLSIFLFASKRFQMHHLLPVLEYGWGPIFQAVFPSMIGFPFGETVILLVLFSQVANLKFAGRVSMLAVGFTGLLLTYSAILQIIVLGVDTRSRSNFPLLNAARGISVGQFLERVDALVVFIMMLGIVTKVALFFYVALKGVEYVFKCPYRPYVFPFSMLVAAFSILIAQNFPEHIKEGIEFTPKFMHMPLQIGIPLLLLLISIWKRKKNTKKQNPEKGGDVHVEKN